MIFSKNSLRKFIAVAVTFFVAYGCASNSILEKDTIKYPNHFNYDTVSAKRFDTGKMWTFEHAPVNYFKETYNFDATEEWLRDVQMSSLKFANWCSASFVSEDGLIMTNHHCVDFILNRFENEGENLKTDGFYAPTLQDERKVKNLFVDQLVLIEDVTDDVINAFNSGVNDKEKESNKKNKIREITDKYSEETGLICRVTELYNGGKFSLYGYKRYDDIRAVYVNESDIGLWGGDPDNFTYPRYNADFAFMRAYDENGQPLKTDNFFKFSSEGAKEGEPIFVVGNPGSTSRLLTVAQLEYDRDFTYRSAAYKLEKYMDVLYELVNEIPERADEFNETIVSVGNSAKVYGSTYRALVDPYILARKKDFEKNFKSKVNADPQLKEKFGHIWQSIENTRTELRDMAPERYAYRLTGRTNTTYFTIAQSMIDLAEELQLPEEKRSNTYKSENLDSTISIIFPAKFDYPVEYKKIRVEADFVTEMLGSSNPIIKKFTNGLTGEAALNYIKLNSKILTPEAVTDLAKQGPNAILNSGDPFIEFILNTDKKLLELDAKAGEIEETENILSEMLGQAMYTVFGTTIPPDATFTLRINDGVLKPFNYNGTIAPINTTFYGMYDRFYSNKGKFPWNLPDRWQHPGADFDMSTPFNFVSTNDITGGSSGSAVINKNAEIIGIAFDGNIESITGNIVYLPEINRMVSVASQAILEIMDDVTSAQRISSELKLGKIPDEYRIIVKADEDDKTNNNSKTENEEE
ncbi:MAG: S46 family peptidase [Bacteroidetes bacterium]|nr:S46 family peptidase [Bacteroidota bacterium]